MCTPSAFEDQAHRVLELMPALGPKLSEAINSHRTDEALTEAVYDEATEMAAEVLRGLNLDELTTVARAALKTAQAALGRMLHTSQLLPGIASPDDNPAPFDDDCEEANACKVQRSFEIYSEERIAAALLSTSLDSSHHPATFEGDPLETLIPDANIRLMIRKTIHDHAANETLIESVYDHAMDMAEIVIKDLNPSQRFSLEQAARHLAAQ